jgi:hemolysin III
MATMTAAGIRPRWRGRIHRWAAIAFVPAFIVLIVLASDSASRLAVTSHAIGVVGMLGVSATYHSGRLSPAAWRVFKRLDHSTILLAIAGTYTAITVLALHGSEQTRMLLVVGIGAALGVTIRMLWLDAPYPVIALVYLVVGWSAVVDLPAYARGTSATELTLVVAGGLLYTIGAVIYALHRPDLWPATFGYHELFHAFVVAGAVCHFAAVALLV